MARNPISGEIQTHLQYLQQAFKLSKSSPSKQTNFRVGAILVAFPQQDPTSDPNPTPSILSTGYTLELPGNTHAEQCALLKLAQLHNLAESELYSVLPPTLNVTLYTSLEPCGKRLSGSLPCVQRIINTRKTQAIGVTGIQSVVFGAKEPGTFVQDSQSCRLLDEAGVLWEYIPDLEREILEVAMAGHEQSSKGESMSTPDRCFEEQKQDGKPTQETSLDDFTPEERARQAAQPRNPKKRMMEVDVPPRQTS